MTEPLVVYTDLDGTLLDHFSYDWSPAAPTLARLGHVGVPVVMVTSKSRTEVTSLRRELRNVHPFIVENGAITVVPEGYFAEPGGLTSTPKTSLTTLRHGPPRAELTAMALELRSALAVEFRTFRELGSEGIAEHTGLSKEAATRAGEREGSEPLLWLESAPEAFVRFRDALRARGSDAVRGGRFVHVLGSGNKAKAVAQLQSRYTTYWGGRGRSVVLGDGPNDIGMLAEADYAVVIPGHHDQPMEFSPRGQVLRPQESGPSGWAWAMERILDECGYGPTT
ncbi:MAG: HAD-IIB family hydrolase [Pseudomonadota bacterium]